jgi:hypothetical protein
MREIWKKTFSKISQVLRRDQTRKGQISAGSSTRSSFLTVPIKLLCVEMAVIESLSFLGIRDERLFIFVLILHEFLITLLTNLNLHIYPLHFSQ